jgi:hypothetical protein
LTSAQRGDRSQQRESATAPRLRLLEDSNLLATGSFLTAIALLTLAAVAPLFRSSNPPRWTTYGWVGELVTLAIVCTLALGLGYLGAGAIEAFQTGPDYFDLGLLAVVLFVSVVVWRRLNARARLKAVEADARLHARVPGTGEARSDLATAAESVPVIASEPPPQLGRRRRRRERHSGRQRSTDAG